MVWLIRTHQFPAGQTNKILPNLATQYYVMMAKHRALSAPLSHTLKMSLIFIVCKFSSVSYCDKLLQHEAKQE
jgi:hypothetical protein